MKRFLLFIFAASISLQGNAQEIQLHDLKLNQDRETVIHVTDKLIEAEILRKQNGIQSYSKNVTRSKVTDEVGDEINFYVQNLETNIFEQKEFRLMRKGNLTQIWFEVAEIENGHLNEAVADSMFKYLENISTPYSYNPEMGIIELINTYLGAPPNIDGDGLVDFLITDIKDGYDPDGGGGYVAGFFHPVDQNLTHTNSNGRDILYIDTFPGIFRGTTDNPIIDPIRPLPTLSHEYQHLVHYRYNGAIGANEITFVNEGQSNFASLLSGYFPHNSYPNYLSNTNVPLFRWSDDNNVLADYGRAASFMSYLWDRLGYENAGLLTQQPLSGLSGIRQAMFEAGSPYTYEELLINWGVANLINDQSVSGDSAYGYENELLTEFRAPVSYEKPQFDNRNTNVQPGAIKYFGFQEAMNIDISVTHEGGNDAAIRVITDDGENVEVIELSSGEAYSTPEDVLYKSVYLMLVYTDPEAEDPLLFTSNVSGEQTYEFTTLRTYGGGTAAGFFNIKGDELLGFSNLYAPGFEGILHEVHLYIHSNGVEGNSSLKISAYTDVDNKPGTEIASDTVAFDELGTEWQVFDVSSWELELGLNEQIHIVYEMLNAGADDIIPVLVDDGKGTQGVTNVLKTDGEFTTFSLTIGDNYGIWNRIVMAQEVVVSNDLLADAPNSFRLNQNYPNPFNPSTRISFTLPSASDVQLNVYNAIGQKVATILDAPMSAGSHEISWDARNLASGVYLYSIKAGDFMQTRKMILMK